MRKHKFKGTRPGRRKPEDICVRCSKSFKDHESASVAASVQGVHHVVMFSGGIGSFCAAERVKSALTTGDKLTLLFTDTKMEDEDLYRFLNDSEKALGITITRIADGRTPLGGIQRS